MADLKSFLDALGLGRYADVLAENDIDLDILPDLTDQDLAQLGLSLGHRRKLMAAAQRGIAAPAAPAPEPAQPPPQAASQAERRQVTVLFADLVGSTELSRRLDPEDLSRIVRQYQDACAGVIARFDGFLAKFMGDGVLAYFGFPQAHEDSTERAARAGLEIAAATRRIGDGTLAARIGIATGLVVVGEIIGSGAATEQTIIGETPNLAARLQSLAEPDAVLIAGMTRRLLGALFEYDFLGEHHVKGIDAPVGVWRVLRESDTASRFKAVRAAGPLVGRTHEIALLAERWGRARAGEGQIVLLAGEAGIGKSRLVEALVEALHDERHVEIRLQCSAYHRNTALHPVIRHLGDTAGFALGDDAARRRDKLRATLSAASPLADSAFRLIAELVGVADSADPAEAMPAAQHKNALLATLAERLLALAGQAPVLLLLEDAHWIDPTTQELLDRIVDRVEATRVLVVATHRPEFVPPWTGRAYVTSLAFNRLSATDCTAIVENVAARTALSSELVAEILRRGDGVPLYVEELTRAVLEGGMDHAPAVPPTLQDSLMARLDRLGRVKDIAQIAAVIGREFARDLVAAIAGIDDEALDRALVTLVAAGLVFPRGGGADARFTFKHALLQEAAYESLLKSRREALHGALARALAARGDAESEPEIAAQHFARAGLNDEASRYWERAGDRAVAQSSYAEAVASYDAALESARRQPAEAVRDRRVLALLLKLGPALIVARGHGHPQSIRCFEEAHTLASALDEPRDLFKATWGLWMSDASRQLFGPAGKRADELIALGDRLKDEDLSLEAIHCRWSTAFFRGEADLALALSAEGAAQYDAPRHHRLTHDYAGHDPGVCALAVSAFTLATVGRVGQVREAVERSLALAESLGHPHSLVHALVNCSVAMMVLRDFARGGQLAGRLRALVDKYQFQPARMSSDFHMALARLKAGEPAGLAEMEAAFERRNLYMPLEFYHCSVMAEAYAMSGRARDALDVIDKTLARAETSEVGLYLPELWRLKGELTLAASAASQADALDALERAAATAARQGARLFELRAVTSLARIAAEAGRREAALERLAPILAALADAAEQPDVAAARRLAATLA